jgi:hypothetical protein
LTIDNIHHADQGTSRQVGGPVSAELIIEDQPKRIIRVEVCLEALSGVNEKPPTMAASPMPGFVQFAPGTP